MTHAIVAEAEGDVQQGGLAKLKSDEPVLIGGVVLWVLAQLGTVLVGHKIIGTQEWTSLTNTYAPIVITVVLAAVSWVIRSLVDSPATAKAKNAALELARNALVQGVLRDADLQKIQSTVVQAIQGKVGTTVVNNPVPAPPTTSSSGALGTSAVTLTTPIPSVVVPPATMSASLQTANASADPVVGGDDRTADVPDAGTPSTL